MWWWSPIYIVFIDKNRCGEAVDDDAFKDFAFAKEGLEEATAPVTATVVQPPVELPQNEKDV